MFNPVRTATRAAAIGALCLGATAALAEYPEKTIDLVVGFAPGGATDVMARTLEPFLEKHLDGANVVVKNVPGAGGLIALAEVAAAEADGYTIGTYNLPGAMSRTLDRTPAYSADDFTFIANVVSDPLVVMASADSEIDSMDKLFEKAREEPGSVTVAMPALGGPHHFLLKELEKLGEVEFTPVPFKGNAPSRVALMGGHVTIGLSSMSDVVSFKDSIRALGVASDEPSDYAPEMPTLASQGYDATMAALRGIVAPDGLPDEAKEKLIAAFEAIFEDPEFAEAMLKVSNPIRLSVGDEFRALNDKQLEIAKETWEKSPWK